MFIFVKIFICKNYIWNGFFFHSSITKIFTEALRITSFKIDYLIGIDPYNNKADIVINTIDYKPKEKFDVILCLGSINFGSSGSNDLNNTNNLREYRS